MAGAALDRQLSTRFAVATLADEAAIRRLLRENPMPGAVTVGFEREPGYFRGADLAGGEDQTIVAFSGSRLVCLGRCTRRDCWVDGSARRVGYLAELRLDASAGGHFRILRDGYEYFHTLQRGDPADLFFTSIAADNDRARRLLESGVRGLPAYDFLAELDTLLVPVPRRAPKIKLHVERATPQRIPDLLRVLNEHGWRHQLATNWTADSLQALETQGLPLNRFLLALDGGEVVACAAVWDQREFRQTVIHGYSPALAVARPFVNLAARILRTPRLPRASSVLAHAFLSPLACTDGAQSVLPDLLGAAFPLAARMGAEFLTIALPTTDPRLPALRRHFSPRTWRSRLYRVAWPDRAPFEFGTSGAAFLPDLCFL